MKTPLPRKLRCAIYTRVSTDSGLEQEFNSLDAQREAAQAYVKSQAHEGWVLNRDRYDDGGYSGGSLERPAMQKLLADIKERRIDVVVVYKVDRLTRSLADFAKLVEVFDGHGVAFVSVTQSFNTTTSMGRLTLNVLLSFAQFEREVTGERIRDKIAASKKKGIWVGGVVPLGYEVRDQKLIVNPDEAATVRLIFSQYLEFGSLPALQRDLRERGIVTRERKLSSGRMVGGRALTNSPLNYLLRNRMYLGEINHRDKSYLGEHDAILDIGLFDAVQARLDENRRGAREKHQGSKALLLGRLFDDRGNPMTPSYAIKKGVRYRYYVSCVLAQGRKEDAGSVKRVAATEVERLVMEAIAEARRSSTSSMAPRSAKRTNHDASRELTTFDDHEAARERIKRVTLFADSIGIELRLNDVDASERLSISWTPQTFRRKREVIAPTTQGLHDPRPMRSESRMRLVSAIASARRWLDEIVSGKAAGIEAIAAREGLNERSARMTLSLAFLAPDIVKAAVDGTLPRGFGVSRLIDMPASWEKQRRAAALPSPP